MLHICSYCRKFLGEKQPYDNKDYTHGICIDCHDRMIKQMDGISFDEYLGEFDFPVVIINNEGRLAAANNSAMAMLDKPSEEIIGFLGGEALECAYARLPEGCGNTVHCPTCTIRRLVNRTRDENLSVEDQEVSLTIDKGEFQMTVSTHSMSGMVRIVIKEIERII